MQFYINELSLEGQYENLKKFLCALEVIYKLKKQIENSGYKLFCDRKLSLAVCVKTKGESLNFEQAILQTRDKNLIRNIRGWIANKGPFLEETDKLSSEEYLQDEFNGIISGSLLGEAVWRTKTGQVTHVVSFSPSCYNKSPLCITWFKDNGKTDKLFIKNFWETKSLVNCLTEHAEAPKSWRALIRQCKNNYKELLFSNELIDILTPHPFIDSIAIRITELLRILNELSSSFDANNQLNENGREIIKNYFHGDNALFSDESDKNKVKFRRNLMFSVSNASKERIYCPWHGKIKHKQYRIHFSWPKQNKKPLYIAYIGPKITKE